MKQYTFHARARGLSTATGTREKSLLRDFKKWLRQQGLVLDNEAIDASVIEEEVRTKR